MESRHKSERTPTSCHRSHIIMSSTPQGPEFRGPSALVRTLQRLHAPRASSCRFLMVSRVSCQAVWRRINLTPNSLSCFLWFRITISTQYKENYTRRHSDSRRPFTRKHHSHQFSMFGPQPHRPLVYSTFRTIESFGLLHYFMD